MATGDTRNVLVAAESGRMPELCAGVERAGLIARSFTTEQAVLSELRSGAHLAVLADAALSGLDVEGLRAAARAGGHDAYIILVGGACDPTGIARGDAAAPDDVLDSAAEPDEIALRLSVAARAATKERARRLREQRLRIAADGTGDAILMMESVPGAGGDLPGFRIVDANAFASSLLGAPRDELVGQMLVDAIPGLTGPSNGAPGEPTWFATAARLGHRAEREIALDAGTGARRHLHVVVTPVEGGALLAARDITERRIRAEEEAARRRVATAVASRREPGYVFEQAAGEAALLLDAEAAAVLRREDGALVTVGAWSSPNVVARTLGSPIPLSSEAAAARAVRSLRPARNDDLASVAAPESQGIRSLLKNAVAAPVWVGSQVWGALAVASSSLGKFPGGAEHRLAHFADLIALAIVNAEDRATLISEARTDALTRIANQRVFHERLSAEVARADRTGDAVSLMVIDLDNFKAINDGWGHAVGDSVIAEFASILAEHAREDDTVARLGGDEFGWILSGAGGEDAVIAGERLQAAVARHQFASVGGMTMSIGIVERGRALDAAALFRGADSALYDAKLGGRDRMVEHMVGSGTRGTTGLGGIRMRKAPPATPQRQPS